MAAWGTEERERDLHKEIVYCSPLWDCEKGPLVFGVQDIRYLGFGRS